VLKAAEGTEVPVHPQTANPTSCLKGLKQTLRTHDKLRLKADFDHVREVGVKYVGRLLLAVLASPPPDQKLRCGVICSKKYSNRAVLRNRARRLMWESFRLLKARIVTCHIVLIARQSMMEASQPEVQTELMALLAKAKALKEETNE